MKRFLVLFISVAFVTVSYAGPNRVGRMKSQDQLEKDRKECTESIENNLSVDAFGKALEECMDKKGYQYQTSQNAVERTGTNEYGQVGWMIRQEALEKDREECTESVDKTLDSKGFGNTLKECMNKKGYQYQYTEEPKKPPSPGMIVLAIAGIIVLSPLLAAYIVLEGAPFLIH